MQTIGTEVSQPSGTNEFDKLRAIEPDYKACIADATLRRRMSHIVKMGVAAGLACLGESQCDAIITATGLGCLADTEKFLNNIIEEEEKLLNPTAFIQSTFNTIGGQIALIRKLHCYNVTYVHRGFSFESAITDAIMQIECGEAQNVLVGAQDEITDTEYEIMKRLSFWHKGAKMGEGAQYFLLSSTPSSTVYAKLTDIEQFHIDGGEEPQERIEAFLKKNKLTLQDIDVVMLGESGDAHHDAHFQALRKEYLRGCNIQKFKHQCGEYPTASAFGVWCAAMKIKADARIKRVLLYNTYMSLNHSLFLIETIR